MFIVALSPRSDTATRIMSDALPHENLPPSAFPTPFPSCSSLTGPYRLKRFRGLSPHSKPVSSQRQEDDRREARSDESVASAFRVHGNGRDPVSEKREDAPLAHRWKLRIPSLFFTERLSFSSLSLAWISTVLFLRHLSIKPLRSLSASGRRAIEYASADTA